MSRAASVVAGSLRVHMPVIRHPCREASARPLGSVICVASQCSHGRRRSTMRTPDVTSITSARARLWASYRRTSSLSRRVLVTAG